MKSCRTQLTSFVLAIALVLSSALIPSGGVDATEDDTYMLIPSKYEESPAKRDDKGVLVNNVWSNTKIYDCFSKDEVVKRINEIRWEFYQENQKNHYVDNYEYVPVKWSSDLEEIAFRRSVECGALFSHASPGKTDRFHVLSVSGLYSGGECLALNRIRVIDAIDAFYSEKWAYIAHITGDSSSPYYNEQWGHYGTMIGYGATRVAGSCSITRCCALEFSNEESTENQISNPRVNEDGITISIDEKYNFYYIDRTGKKTLLETPQQWRNVLTNAPMNEWRNGKWYDANGEQTYKPTLSWKRNKKGWWAEDTSGWYPRNTWQKIDGKWYFFNKSGYMLSNQWVNGFYLYADGHSSVREENTGSTTYDLGSWQSFQNTRTNAICWVYGTGFGNKGIDMYYRENDLVGAYDWLASGWACINQRWYYFGADHFMVTGFQKIKGKLYFFASSGAMKTGWIKSGANWYYAEGSGAVVTNAERKIGGKTYKFDGNGVCLNP